ncbi:hypothetical protein [uncultured Thiodictyon sp.]|jgi:hypothetical protein|uniref:hypothetical protein n=1 Tax=uncultured Thiodictyon sp. TaxID=1846217 RepID=UPI0025D5F25C|nr:hypothetical protein [uncultured Thiodictyon sp.]
MPTHPHLTRCALVTLAALVAGCANDEEREANATFGESVRLTIAQQTAHPGTAGTGLDGVQAAAALKAYREDVAVRKKVEAPPLLIRLGQ